MNSALRMIPRRLLGLAATVAFGGFLGATLVRLSPGWDVDEAELDLRRSEESIQSLRERNGTDRSLVRFYCGYLAGLFTGDLGESRALRQPVSDLIRERIPQTVRTAGLGLLFAWTAGLGVAIALSASGYYKPRGYSTVAMDAAAAMTSGLLLSLPAAVIGFLALLAGIPPEWAVGAALFPKVYRFSHELLAQAFRQPHVFSAISRGVSRGRILTAHVLRPTLHPLLALGGVSLSLAFGAAIPLEVVLDSPGIGQLAWKAAISRDMPVLIGITLLVTLVVKVSALAVDVARSASENTAENSRA